MRYLPFFGMVVVALAATACGSSVSLPAVEPDQVAIYLPGSPTPAEDYKILARIDEKGPQSITNEELIDKAKQRAADMGADALIISTIRLTTEGQAQLNLDQPVEKFLEGIAVYFPSKHPELVAEK